MHARNPSTQSPNRTSLELEGERALVITRTFNGPARLVFEAWTKPEFVERWWAPKSHGVTLASCTAEVRVGGQYRYVLRQRTGEEFAFSGEYREITPHTRLVYTQRFEPFPEPAVITVTFEERDHKTRLVAHELYPSAEARNGALASGMEHGMRETMDQLEQLLQTLR